MATIQAVSAPHAMLLARLHECRARTDDLFKLLRPNALYERPIAERHRLIFYVGHLEAFDWNLFVSELGIEGGDPSLDKLFAFGIDPVDGGLPTDVPGDWPTVEQVERYNRNVRTQLDQILARTASNHDGAHASLQTLLNVAIEHRLMHAETLAYLFHNMSLEHKADHVATAHDPRPAPQPRQVTIPAGTATLGQSRDNGAGSGRDFGWDNEFETERVDVPGFSIDVFPVTNHEYLKFVQAGGYKEPSYWSAEDWEWRRKEGIEHPHFWMRRGDSPASDPQTEWEYRGMFGAMPLPPSWPVFVSHAEAEAFARWQGKKLPTESQWHRAAYGTARGVENLYPWGSEPVEERRGNFHHQRWEPTAVDEHSTGASSFGVFDLLGNGWEWTSTPFGPFRGFEPFPFYNGYSANFFDGKHFVMKGGSQRTDACMLRRSYRNWFQPHYPYIYATFRCVEE